MRCLIFSAVLALGLGLPAAAEAGNCFGTKILDRAIAGEAVDFSRFFTMCPGAAVISIDADYRSDAIGMVVQRGKDGAVVCDRSFPGDAHTCSFNVRRRDRYYVRVINFGGNPVQYRFIAN